jgi:hypothetical protein
MCTYAAVVLHRVHNVADTVLVSNTAFLAVVVFVLYGTSSSSISYECVTLVGRHVLALFAQHARDASTPCVHQHITLTNNCTMVLQCIPSRRLAFCGSKFRDENWAFCLFNFMVVAMDTFSRSIDRWDGQRADDQSNVSLDGFQTLLLSFVKIPKFSVNCYSGHDATEHRVAILVTT